MDFQNLKDIKDKRNEIENIRNSIRENLEKIKDVVIYNNFDFILDDIRNNVEINKYSMSSIFDNSEPLYKESRNYIDNNLEFIYQLKLDGILHYIGNDFKGMFKNINITLNLYIVENLTFDDDNIEMDLFDMNINEIKEYIENNQFGFTEIDYLSYLEKIYNFYDSLNTCIENMINNYGKYIL